MKVTLESTTQIVMLNGTRCRLWQGESERGVPCHALIPTIAVADDQDSSEFDAELERHAAPRPDIAYSPRMLL